LDPGEQSMKNDPNAQSIQHMARAFSRSRILLTGAELDIFSLLAAEPLAAESVASRLGADTRAVTILLDALSAMGLLDKDGSLYRTPPDLIPVLTVGSDESILPSLLHSAHLWKTWSQLTDVVRKGGPASRPDRGEGDRTKAFIGAMHVRALHDATELVRTVDPGAAGRLIDVGGGSGSYTIGFLKAVPGMRATLFDLPEVISMARERISAEGLSDRVDLAAGDYNEDDLPGGHDLAFLSAIIHQNSHEQNITLYQKIHGALIPGGRVIVRDYAMTPDRTRPPSGALFAVNMLVNTEAGNSYTLEEIKAGLQAAGFERVKLLKDDEMSSLVEGYRP